jgi:chromosome segregation ATPase
MAELTNKVEADLVLDRKMEAGQYGGGDLHNYVASQELTVTITLSEYRELVSGIATKDKDISIANDKKYEREQEIREVRAANDALKAENYDLKVAADGLRKQIDDLERKLKTNDAANTQQAEMISDLRKKLKEAQETILYLQKNIDDITGTEKGDSE